MGGGRGGVGTDRNRLLCRTGPTGCGTPARRRRRRTRATTTLGPFIARSSAERFASSVRTLHRDRARRRRHPRVVVVRRRVFFFFFCFL